MDNVAGIVTVLGTLSLSVERIVQMIKNTIPFLDKAHDDDVKERWRRTSIQMLSIIVGALIAFVAKDQIQAQLSNIFGSVEDMQWHSFVILGLLASGGSGLWNHTLSIIEEFKKSKQALGVKNKMAESH